MGYGSQSGALLLGRSFVPGALLELLINDPGAHREALAAIDRDASPIALYFGTLYFAAWTVPALLRTAISHFGWDRPQSWLSRWFRFDAPWYYLLKGLDFGKDQQPDLIRISALVEVGGEAVLYVGYLDDFYVTADGTLDRLVLTDVERRPFGRDKSPEDAAERFYPVDGKYFVLRYSEAITLNIVYLRLVKEPLPSGNGRDAPRV